MSLFFSFRASDTPPSVPPVPTAQMNPSTRPFVCSQISSAVVVRWPSRLAWLSNWRAQMAEMARAQELLAEAKRYEAWLATLRANFRKNHLWYHSHGQEN